jgi:succinoglycan biosynthesis transport protein ExoP
MDFGYLIRLLARRKWLILSVMAVAAAATFLFIEMRPERYKSAVIVSTGIVNYKGINSDNDDAFVQQYQVENAFSNLIEFAQSRSTIKLLTIHMLRHDLSAQGAAPGEPFREYDPGLLELSPDDTSRLLPQLTGIQLDSISDPSFSQEFDYLLDKVARAYGYDHDAILRSLEVKRKGETDYLSLEMSTESPQLSQYMANTFVQRFMTYYHNLSVREKRKIVQAYEKQAAEKKAIVDSIKDLRYDYLYRNSLPALGRQSEELVSQIAALEMDYQRAESRRQATEQSLDRMQRYIDDKSSLNAGETRSRVLDKSNVAELSERVRRLKEESVKTAGKDPEVEEQLAQSRQDLDRALRSSARNIGRPRGQDESRQTKEDLFKDKVDLDMDRIDAERSASRLRQEIRSMKSKLTGYVKNDEIATTMEADEQRAEMEFTRVNDELIRHRLELENVESPLRIEENAQLPEHPEPNRQVLLSLFAGIVGGSLTTIVLFMLAYLDTSLQSPEHFKRFVEGLPLLGAVSAVPVKGLDFQRVFSTNGEMPHYTALRESLRKLRGSLLRSPERVYLFVSTQEDSGKTFTMHALAFSLAANQKRVVMIDTNFKTPLPEAYTEQPTPNSEFLNQAIRDNELHDVFQLKNPAGAPDGDVEHRVDIIGNLGLHLSPAELLPQPQFQQFIRDLQERYDYVFMEAAALNNFSDTQELAPFAEKLIAVFRAGAVIRAADRDSIAYLQSLGDKFAGSVLTGVDARNL